MAARLFLTPIDMNKNEVQNMRLQNLSADPSSPVEGQLYHNTTNHRPRWRDNSAWNDIYPSTSANTPNTEVLRDGSGNFSAGTITGNLTGTASQATALDDGTTTYRSGSYYLNFGNTTGTRTHTAISDFDTQVRTSRLDQMAAPTASVSLNSQTITNLADPVNPQDAATKNYVDGVATGLDFKQSVRVATAAALPAYTRTGSVITASANGSINNTGIDGITNLAVNDRVLLKDGAAGSDNGIYVVTTVGSAGAAFVLTRASDANSSAEVTSGMYCFIEEGTTNASTGWVLSTSGTITLNTTALTFTQFTGTGEITAGNGITKSGNTLSANLSARLTFTSGAIDLANAGTAGTYTSVTTDQYGRVTSGADIITANGIVTRTAAGTFTNRTVTGTTNRVAVTNGNGVSGNPTIDIDSAYVGQTSITTLGTITAGTWTATAIGTTYGGTGVDGHLAANGTLLIGNGSGYTLTTLTQGANVTITNGSGTITIAATGTIGGSIANTQVAFGSGSNTIQGSANFTYASATGLVIGTGTTPLSLTQSAASTGSPNAISLTAGAHTTLTASTEAIDVLFNLARTVQFAQGALATQRAVRITAPTYAFATGASTLTKAATFAISGAPAAGTNATLTNSYALWVEAGLAQFDGTMTVVGATTHQGAVTFNTSTTPIIVTQGAASSGVPTGLSFTGGAHTALTAGSEAISVNFNLAQTVQHAQGALATQRAFVIQAPTYSFATGASTLTTAATFAVTGAPAAGTNATITNSYAVWVQAGTTRLDGGVQVTGAAALATFTQSVATSGSPTGLTFTGAAHTTLTASTEAIDVLFNLARTVQFAQGALTTQRALRVTAPTYAFATGASTLTTAATFAISGAPAAGTNATLTNTYAFWVESGKAQFDGTLGVAGASTFAGTVTFNTASANIVVTQGVATSGSPSMAALTGAAHTTLTASTEAIDVNVNLARTVQFAQGALTTQRAVVFQAPTYAFATGASTLTTAATVAITNQPQAGTNATITNSYALWIQAGVTRFDGNVSFNDAVNIVAGSTTGTKIGTATSQKLGFFNATPVVQQTGEVATALAALGLVTSGSYAAASITGTLSALHGGTGLDGSAAANGTLLIGNGSGYSLATLTQGTGITITNGAGTITISASGTVNKYTTTVGNGSLTSITVTHNLGSLAVVVQVYDSSTGDQVECGVNHTTTNTVTLTFATAPASGAYTVVVVG